MAVGCGSHTAAVYDRDGGLVARADVLVRVEWTRVLDDTSTATILVQPGGDCCEALAKVRPWRHKLVIWREGRPVWEGPVIVAKWDADGVEIVAGDVLAWLDRRVPHRNMRFTDTDLADIAAALILDGFSPDDPGHTVQVVGAAGIAGSREYETDVGQVGDHLADLARTGVDYTAVGSRILIMPEGHCARVGRLTDADFPAGLGVTEDGSELGTRWIVHGKDDVRGEAGGKHAYYGLLERSVEESSILDTGSATAAAWSRLRASTPTPMIVDSQQATLSPDAAVDVPSLVPGWCVDVTTTSTCRTVGQALKILTLKVVEDGGGETVSVQLVPAGV